jgi:small-conductance mechanosensitive channel
LVLRALSAWLLRLSARASWARAQRGLPNCSNQLRNRPEHARDEATAQAIAALLQRMLIASRAVVALMAIALVLMSLGHYF